jgi:hypothetical protein
MSAAATRLPLFLSKNSCHSMTKTNLFRSFVKSASPGSLAVFSKNYKFDRTLIDTYTYINGETMVRVKSRM